MTLSRPKRRQLILAWIGIGFAWVASFVLAAVLLTDWIALAVPATAVAALGVGAIVTKRLHAHHRRASITVGDLRGTTSRSGARRG
jgi:hypothetical protein